MPFGELPDFMTQLRRHGALARIQEFQILTTTRPNEALGARWSEIDMDERVWTIPGSRMKTKIEHRIPLSASAIAVLRQMEPCRRRRFFVKIAPGMPN
jgi:integrase